MIHLRCAIYTRKSSEEGLEQSFNSLDAQREACEAYVLSQRHEGWHGINTHYDDGGFSGGNMERPALKRLMADIEAGKIQVVVVYKVDRLTRSLSDFARIIEQFDAKKVSFVSVTQQFNTTSSMGRLTLNVLLSFAQFEREVTGERIRDKIAASKRKGMWMGGRVPLGYDLHDRKLYINLGEAVRIRDIYDQYLRLGSVAALKNHLDNASVVTKVRAGDGRNEGGKSFSRGCLYKILRNPIYAGLIAHQGSVYPAQHQGIIGRERWDHVQKSLLEHRQGKHRKPRKTQACFLTGILFDEQGNRFTPTHSTKAGRRYRYYTSQLVIRKAGERQGLSRIPAHELEEAVTGRFNQLLRSPEELLSELKSVDAQIKDYRGLIHQGGKLAADWPHMARPERQQFLQLVLARVIVQSGSIAIQVKAAALAKSLGDRESSTPPNPTGSDSDLRHITLTCPFRFVRQGKALRLVIGNGQDTSAISTAAILKAIARSRFWYDQIVTGEVGGFMDIAKKNNFTLGYVKHIFRFASLGPAAVEAILQGKSGPSVTLKSLASRVPLEWSQQHSILVEP